MRSIIERNQLEAPYKLNAGQQLVIPAVQRQHTVRAGDTLYGISRAYGVDTTSVVRENRLEAPYTLVIGQELRIPSAGTGIASRSPAPRVQASAAEEKPPRQTTPAPRQEEQSTAVVRTPKPKPQPPSRAPSKAPPEPVKPPSITKRGFLTPVQGNVLSKFGPKADGLHNDGINIAAPRGTPIRAAENGVVAYAGDELPGFGNLILIKHSDGWTTAYAHSDRMLVKRGQRVSRGQVIARVGSTGNVDRPQLHFEMRRNDKAVDPSAYLSGTGI